MIEPTVRVSVMLMGLSVLRVSPAQEPRPSRRIAANTALRAGGEVVAKIASLAFFVVMARELGKEGFGDFNFALALATLLVSAAGFGMDGLLAREVARDRELAHEYLSNVVAIKLLSSAALLILIAVIVGLGGYDEDARLTAYLVGAGVAIENLGRSWQYTMQGLERLGLVSFSVIVQRTFTAAAAIALMLGGAGVVSVAAVFLLGALLGLLAAALMLRWRVLRLRPRIEPGRWGSLVRTAIPIGLVGLMFNILLQLDATLLSFLTGGDNEEVGVYSAAFRLVAAFMFLSWAFGSAVQPWLTRQEGGIPLARGHALGLKLLTAVLLPLGIGFTVLAEPIVELLYGDDYASAVLPLRLLGVVIGLYGVNQLTSILLISRYRPGEFRTVLVVVLGQNLICNLVLIPLFAADGAAASAAASAVLLALLSVRSGARVVGELPLARAFAGPAVAGAAMAVTLLLADPPLGLAIPLGAFVYGAVLVLFERALHPDDLSLALAALRRDTRATASPAAGSR
jgi:O-antigen/teichoic acid export membrane protein